jgi:hypothetical protein
MKTASNIVLRIVATFAASALSVIGAGAVAGVPLWKAFFMARGGRGCYCYRGIISSIFR